MEGLEIPVLSLVFALILCLPSACHDWGAERNLYVQIFHVEELLFI